MHYLIIEHVQPQDAGQVLCVATNSEGETRATVTLDVFVLQDFRFLQLRPVATTEYATNGSGLDPLLEREYRWRREAMGDLAEAFDKVA